MDAFCGRPSHLWGPLSKHYLSHCFDDLFVFGFTYVFLFMCGAYRVVTLRSVPAAKEFPHSTRHSVKVLLLSWLGVLPLVVFAVKYVNHTHGDFEWVAKPLASLAWFFSLWIMNLETMRDMRECWVLRTFWLLSAVAGVIALPTVVLHAEAQGYGFGFYVYVIQFCLYMAMGVAAVKYTHNGGRVTPQDPVPQVSQDEPRDTPLVLLSTLWWDYTWRLFSLFSPEKYLCGMGAVCVCVSAPLSALALVILGRLFNNLYYPYSTLSAQAHLRDYCLALIVIYTFTCFLDALFTMAFFVAGERMAARTRRRVFHSILRQETAFFDTCKVDSLTRVLKQDVVSVQRAMTEQLSHGLSCVITIIVSITIQFFLSWKMTIVVLSVGPVCVLAIALQRHFASDLAAAKTHRLGALSRICNEALGRITLLRSYGGEQIETERFGKAVQGVSDLAFRYGLLDLGSKGMVSLMFQLTIALGLYVGGVLVLGHQLEVGYLISLFALEIIMVSATAQLPELVTQFEAALTSSEAVFKLLDRVPNVFPKGQQVVDNPDGHICFTDVTFAYPRSPSQLVLHGLRLDVPAGATTLVVGPRGSGKSSLVALAQRLYDAQGGAVTLDDRDVRNLEVNWLREKIGVVPQDPVVFAITIAANVGYGSEGLSQTTVEKAARASGCHEWIQALPDGYQAVAGDKGVRLSVAQKVQIALARALATDPACLILDDCLASLDANGQRETMAAVERLMAHRTVLVLSSRPDVPVNADTFWLMTRGAATQVSSKTDLYDSSSLVGTSVGGGGGGGGSVVDVGVVLEAMEQVVLQERLDKNVAMDVLELINDIKEARGLEATGGDWGGLS